MYISKWELKYDSDYYQTTISFKQSLTPFFKVRVIPKKLIDVFQIVIRDYISGLLLSERTFVMIKNNRGEVLNTNQAKLRAEALAQTCLEDLTSVV